MPAFHYDAVDGSGKHKRGVIEASNAAAARRSLRAQALLPVSVKAGGASSSTAGSLQALLKFGAGKVSSRALSATTRQLSTLIGSDVRIDEALQLAAAQADATLKAVLLDVRGAVVEGTGFARALGGHPAVFPEFYRAAIHSGEQSSRLPEVLVHLADFVEARHRAHQKLRLALIYPALLAAVSAVMMTMMMVYVIPDIARVFVSRGADLPFLTRLLIAVSDLLANWGLYLLAGLVLGGFLATRAFAQPARRLAFDRMLATRRPFAKFTREANAARFTATLATLVQSAVPLLDALWAAAAVVPNRHIRAQVEAVAAAVREGGSVHRAMSDTGAFPSLLIAIVASGETGGKLGPALARAATELDRDVEAQVNTMVSLVEPLVLLAMGGLVLLMVMAILMPIIGLNDLALT